MMELGTMVSRGRAVFHCQAVKSREYESGSPRPVRIAELAGSSPGLERATTHISLLICVQTSLSGFT